MRTWLVLRREGRTLSLSSQGDLTGGRMVPGPWVASRRLSRTARRRRTCWRTSGSHAGRDGWSGVTAALTCENAEKHWCGRRAGRVRRAVRSPWSWLLRRCVRSTGRASWVRASVPARTWPAAIDSYLSFQAAFASGKRGASPLASWGASQWTRSRAPGGRPRRPGTAQGLAMSPRARVA